MDPTSEEATNLPTRPRGIVVGDMGLRRTFSALKHRNFRLFCLGQLISLIGTWMQSTAQGWLVYEMTHSKLILGWVATLGSLPMLFFSIWGGLVADRHSKRSVLVMTQTLAMLLAFILTVLVYAHWVKTWHIILLATANGVVLAFDMPARQAFVVEMTSKEDLTNAISLNSSIFNTARILGPSFAGILMANLGMTMCFFLNGVSFIPVIIALMMMRLPPSSASTLSSRPAGVLDGVSYVKQNPKVRTILILLAFTTVFGWAFTVLMPAFARDVMKVNETGYGWLLSANGFGALLGALTVASMAHLLQPRRLMQMGLWLIAVMLLLLAFSKNYSLSILCLVAMGMGLIMFFATANSMVQLSVPDQMRGQVMGVWGMTFGGMMPVGSFINGSLAHYLGITWTFAMEGIICLGLAFTAQFSKLKP